MVANSDPRHLGIGSRLVAETVAAAYARHLPAHCKGRLLDLGCGSVPFFEAYRDLVTDNICVDWMHSRHDISYLDRECDLTQPLPFDEEFDTIILSDVLEHIPDPDLLWAEMFRILNPSGKLLLNVPFFYWLHENPHDYYRYTEWALKRFADRNGFDVLVIERLGGVPEILADITAKTLASRGRLGRWAASAVQGACRQLLKTKAGYRFSQRTSERFPGGYFLVAQRPAL